MTTLGTVRYSFPAFKVFVFGVDVTRYVSQVTTNWHDKRAPSTCSFVLANDGDRFIVRPDEIEALYNLVDVGIEKAVLSADAGDWDDLFLAPTIQAVQQRLTTADIPDEKRRVLLAKSKVFIKDVVASRPGVPFNAISSVQDVSELVGAAVRYPYQAGSCIFHTNDPVRVFVRDPFDARVWYYGATGFVSDWSETVDKNNQKGVTVTVEDALRVFKHARIATNSAIYDAKTLQAQGDVLFRSWFTDNFSDVTLPELFFTMGFGSTKAGTNERLKVDLNSRDKRPLPGANPFTTVRCGVNGRVDSPVATDGQGAFNLERSGVFVLGRESKPDPDFVGPLQEPVTPAVSRVGGKDFTHLDALFQWQSRISHRVRPNDIAALGLPGDPNVAADAQEIRALANAGLPYLDTVIQKIGEHPERYPVDFGRIMMLVPAELDAGTNRDLLLKDLVTSISSRTQFTSRLAILYNLCERIEFSLYATPRGDIVCEMPLYDFDPRDFEIPDGIDANGDSLDPVVDGILSTAFENTNRAGTYTVPSTSIISVQSTFSDENVFTQARVGYGILQNFRSGGTSDDLWQVPGVVQLPHLMPQFGPRTLEAEPWGFINTQKGAEYFGQLKLNQANSNAWTNRVEMVIRMGVGPNRPLQFNQFEYRDQSAPVLIRTWVATTRNITQSIVWNSGVTMSVETNYRRGWAGQTKTVTVGGVPQTVKVYEPIGGFASRPLDYRRLFEKRKGGASTQDPSKLAEGAPTVSSSDGVRTKREQAQDAANARGKAQIRALAEANGIKVRFTQERRTQEQQDAIIASQEKRFGRTIAVRHSHHVNECAVDVNPVDPSQRDQLEALLKANANKLPPGAEVIRHGADIGKDHIHVEWRLSSVHTGHAEEST